MMWQELLMLIKAQVTLLNQLLDLARKQRGCLLDHGIEQNREIIKQQENIFSKLAQLEKKKENVYVQIRTQKCVDGIARKDDLLSMIDFAPINEQQILFAQVKQLHEVMKKLRIMNQDNKKLVDNEMRFIDFNINIMTQTTADDIYAPRGQNGSVISKKKMFDQSI